MFSQKGSSLLAVILAVLITTTIFLTINGETDFSRQTAHSVSRTDSFFELVNQVQTLIASPGMCGVALAGQMPAVGRSVSLTFPTSPPFTIDDSTNNVFDNGNLIISSMKWTAITAVSAVEKIGWFTIVSDIRGQGTSPIVGGYLRTYPDPSSGSPGIMVDFLVNGGGSVTGCSAARATPYHYSVAVGTGTYTVLGFGGPPGTKGNFEIATGVGSLTGGTIPLPGPVALGWNYRQTIMSVGVSGFYHDRDIPLEPNPPILSPGSGIATNDGICGTAVGVNPLTGGVLTVSCGTGHSHYQYGQARAAWTSYSWRTVP